ADQIVKKSRCPDHGRSIALPATAKRFSPTDVIGHSSGRRTPLVYGGVHIWHDAAAMQAYLASDLAKGVVGNPNFANLTSRDFEVLSGPTTSSGGPVAASLTATPSLAS